MNSELKNFVRESNKIESILREPTNDELSAHWAFICLRSPSIADLESFVSIVAPGHRLRDKVGLNVRVGNHIAPSGGLLIRAELEHILTSIKIRDPWHTHVVYETLHPFTDGNGRSGRALWLWQMGGEASLGFLHRFYYQTLSGVRS